MCKCQIHRLLHRYTRHKTKCLTLLSYARRGTIFRQQKCDNIFQITAMFYTVHYFLYEIYVRCQLLWSQLLQWISCIILTDPSHSKTYFCHGNVYHEATHYPWYWCPDSLFRQVLCKNGNGYAKQVRIFPEETYKLTTCVKLVIRNDRNVNTYVSLKTAIVNTLSPRNKDWTSGWSVLRKRLLWLMSFYLGTGLSQLFN